MKTPARGLKLTRQLRERNPILAFVGAGLVASLARPGGNLTGTSLLSSELSVKWLELLKETVPELHRVAVLWNPDNDVNAREVDGMMARGAKPRS